MKRGMAVSKSSAHDTCVILLLAITFTTTSRDDVLATIIEVDDLNIIQMAGNPSDGLRFLDMWFSDGLTENDALTEAKTKYPNARLATPSEHDDLFAGANIKYGGTYTASDAFATGVSAQISTGANYDGGTLAAQLGHTYPAGAAWWSSPDGSGGSDTTRDYTYINVHNAVIENWTETPPHQYFGWLIVSEPAVIPEPSTMLLLGIGLMWLTGVRRKIMS